MNESNDDIARKKAVALRYDEDSTSAPRLIAKGSGHLAEKILALAKENDIYVHEDADLLNVLTVLDLQSEIPDHLYLAVAEILAFVYNLNNSMSEPQA